MVLNWALAQKYLLVTSKFIKLPIDVNFWNEDGWRSAIIDAIMTCP
jgi:hypothetical protein